jgi:hypothetical protein
MKVQRFIAVIGLVACCALAMPGRAEEPKSPFEILHGDLKGIQNNLTNVNMRMRNPAAGGSITGAEGEPQTPGATCCSSNLDRIEKRMRSTSQVLERLQIEYTDGKNARGLQSLEIVHREMSIVSRGLAMFKMARTNDTAKQALAGLIRPFNRWRDATVDLEKCCSGAEPAESEDAKSAREVAVAPTE